MFDADHERRRKEQLRRLYNRTPEQVPVIGRGIVRNIVSPFIIRVLRSRSRPFWVEPKPLRRYLQIRFYAFLTTPKIQIFRSSDFIKKIEKYAVPILAALKFKLFCLDFWTLLAIHVSLTKLNFWISYVFSNKCI